MVRRRIATDCGAGRIWQSLCSGKSGKPVPNVVGVVAATRRRALKRVRDFCVDPGLAYAGEPSKYFMDVATDFVVAREKAKVLVERCGANQAGELRREVLPSPPSLRVSQTLPSSVPA